MPRHDTFSPSQSQLSLSTVSTSTTSDTDPCNSASHGSVVNPDTSDTQVQVPRSRPKRDKTDPLDPYEEYFIQQAKLFKHLEKRYSKFQKKQKEEQARARDNRLNRKHTPAPAPVKPKKKKDKQRIASNSDSDTSNSSSTSSAETDNMIGSSVAAIRGQAGKAVAQAVRPAISITRASSPAASASFSSTASTSVRSQKLQTKKKKFVNPDAMTATEAVRVLRALEIANPTSSYSLTLSTKSTKSSLPIRGHFHLPLDPRRSSETILVFAEPSSTSSTLAKQAGAAYVGGEELFESVLSGKISPTRCLATPGMMPQVTRNLARYLGPKGLMPVAKRGLVGEGEELAEKIRDAAGRMEYRADKEGLVRIPVARMDFEIPSIENNIRSFIQTVRDNQSAGTTDDAVTNAAKKKKKGSSITAARIETTHGPSIEINDVL
ncbi:50S small subunit ribosomal protein L1 [Kwoniella mangroviensis CBS 10435]|uniref:50S small subunit ribosomal protein L1 n=1 Tax=Kwoniella mangroviensis CBS 10435 TaxID=1331196 RepID=A0A1B9IKL7_9TREE|nr:50S small subunit ribosomal protein L1 [Kwoniella mangroviensis CBS 8507]OCF56186.1 50S small subunit ribosomal protein L1 [Kwoniella mangroviensis CBS 10435]OCF65091.1 50S small subunit ribosomal protein L1 [Kwoniella mangroviensis CBS 8507]OCF78935.1 50S small subunit ribosomal protein L1 [Kwoniella mangroviensis CBS 8886]